MSSILVVKLVVVGGGGELLQGKICQSLLESITSYNKCLYNVEYLSVDAITVQGTTIEQNIINIEI